MVEEGLVPDGETPSRAEDGPRQRERIGRLGIPVDAAGGPTIDPTKNVLDLVYAESKYQDSMRGAEARISAQANASLLLFTNFAREAESKILTLARESESKRLDQLSALREVYEKRIADMLSESVRSTSTLVSTQLLQIQSTFDARINKLEEFRLTTQGKSSVAEPQTAHAIEVLAHGMQEMQAAFTRTIAEMSAKQASVADRMAGNISMLGASQSGTIDKDAGRRELVTWIVGGILLLATLSGVVMQAVALSRLGPH